MAQKTCPDCGREITGYGRYCNFCGWDLRKKKPADPGTSAVPARKQEREDRPVRNGAIIAIITVLAIAAVSAAALWFSAGGNVFRGTEKLPGDLSGIRTNFQAVAEMKSAGFRQISSSSGSLGDSWTFDSRKVLGVQTEYSILHILAVSEKQRMTSVNHYFPEEEAGTIESPGKTMRKLLDALTAAYGTPEKDEKYYTWKDRYSRITLGYGTGGMVVIGQYYMD